MVINDFQLGGIASVVFSSALKVVISGQTTAKKAQPQLMELKMRGRLSKSVMICKTDL